MFKGRELTEFRKQLLGWFRQFQRDLPWRRSNDPYRIWLSEIMLQQTRVAAVIPYYEKFLERFPDVRALAAAPREEVLRMWSGLGYYSRARNLQAAAEEIASKHQGKFPEGEKEVLALPGIGPYTAAAVLSIAFGKKCAVLDGNVARVLARMDALRGDLRDARRWHSLQKTASALLDPKFPGDWNEAMMELGATVCTPKSPQCLLCPVAKFCRAQQLGIAEELPEKRKKRDTVGVTLAAAVFTDAQGRTLLLPPPKASGGKAEADDIPTLVSKMWHFPTISAKENPREELLRHMKQFLKNGGAHPAEFVALGKVHHAVTYRSITIFPFRLNVERLPRIASAKTPALDNLSSLPISNLTRKIGRAALESLAADRRA